MPVDELRKSLQAYSEVDSKVLKAKLAKEAKKAKGKDKKLLSLIMKLGVEAAIAVLGAALSMAGPAGVLAAAGATAAARKLVEILGEPPKKEPPAEGMLRAATNSAIAAATPAGLGPSGPALATNLVTPEAQAWAESGFKTDFDPKG